MSEDTRINLRLSKQAADRIRVLAGARDQTMVGIVREALGILETAHEGRKAGLYLGLTAIRENLQTVLAIP